MVRRLAHRPLRAARILGAAPVRSELVWLLVQLDKDYAAIGPDSPWPDWYAQRVIDQLGRDAPG